MSDHDAYPIQWSAPSGSVGEPAWSGPRPDAEVTAGAGAPNRDEPAAQSAPARPAAPAGGLGDPWAQPRPASTPTGSTPLGWAGTSNDTAESISASHPADTGYGWSGTSGAAHFDAPDRGDHAPRRSDADVPAPGSASFPKAARPAVSSYAEAPSSGSTGNGAPWSSTTYPSGPPQVVGQHDDLPEDSLTIGRSRSNSIVLDDMLVSRRHVVITADDEGLLLRDMGSRNGTFVNGRRVEQTHLHEGDRIGIGASTFEVRDGWLVSV